MISFRRISLGRRHSYASFEMKILMKNAAGLRNDDDYQTLLYLGVGIEMGGTRPNA